MGVRRISPRVGRVPPLWVVYSEMKTVGSFSKSTNEQWDQCTVAKGFITDTFLLLNFTGFASVSRTPSGKSRLVMSALSASVATSLIRTGACEQETVKHQEQEMVASNRRRRAGVVAPIAIAVLRTTRTTTTRHIVVPNSRSSSRRSCGTRRPPPTNPHRRHRRRLRRRRRRRLTAPGRGEFCTTTTSRSDGTAAPATTTTTSESSSLSPSFLSSLSSSDWHCSNTS